jgi:hypothetical protein
LSAIFCFSAELEFSSLIACSVILLFFIGNFPQTIYDSAKCPLPQA